jgi:extracellular elastinolytic metalloproteinase
MVREIDTRDFTSFTGSGRGASARAAAVDLTSPMSGGATLTARDVSGLTGNPKMLSASAAPTVVGSLIEDALREVRQSSAALGFAASTPAEFTPDPHVYTTSAGSNVVHLHQQHHGIPVFGMARTVRYSKDRQLRAIAGDNIDIAPDVAVIPTVNAKHAMRAAAHHLAQPEVTESVDVWGQPLPNITVDADNYEPEILASFDLPSHPTVVAQGPFGAVIPMHLVFFPQGSTTRLAWRITATMPDQIAQYIIVVAADRTDDVAILYCRSNTHAIAARGNVYVHNPGERDRQMVDFPLPLTAYPIEPPLELPEGFPQNWVDETVTQGNNTKATLGFSTQTYEGTLQDGVVIFDPSSNTDDDQKVLNTFYFCCYMHDFFYMLGFDEASGNFQAFNFTGAGDDEDPVRARAHSGPVIGTANMGTPVDGSPPVMNMGLVASTDRHTAFDSDVVFHEFAHGLTNRLVGGRMNVDALDMLQSGGMGEGWGDYFALTIQNYFRNDEKVVTGDWVTNRSGGIRGFPYDENFPDHFGHLGTGRYTGVHNIGEIWCAALMHMNRRIGAELGDVYRGHRLSWQIVVDALKLSPANPSFLDMRDAILEALADMRDSGRLNEPDYATARRGAWTAFARFGMGPNAQSPTADLFGIEADFQLPVDLQGAIA